ncbi:MAG: DUF502 domain-containing protein [Patescibacteria group bacterium]|nr:DUF502 domain-containing protein [Patescibacteria group bacterium]
MIDKITSGVKSYFAGGWKHIAKITFGGLLAAIPIFGTVYILYWMYEQMSILTMHLFSPISTLIGFDPSDITFLWTITGSLALFFILYAMGHFIETKFGNFINNVFTKLPVYKTIKGVVDLFNTTKSDKKALVVYTRGMVEGSYMAGLVNSVKEATIENHYTVSYNMSPAPTGGFMMEFPSDQIYVVKSGSLDDMIKYLLAMGTDTFPEILGRESSALGSENLPTLESWIEKNLNQGED